MDEVSTSPDTTAEAPADVSSGSVESAVPSGESTGTTEAAPQVSAAPTTPVAEEPTAPAFNTEQWDGNLDTLPSHLKEPVQFLHRQLESGFTKKFQGLSDERKTFETERDAWTEKSTGWNQEKGRLESELSLLRNLMNGEEDPRVGEFQEKNSTLTQDLAKLQSEYAHFKELVETDINEQAQTYANRFKAEHSDIFESEEKRGILSNLLDQGWTPEAGVKLINQDERVIGLATELKGKGVPPEVAVEHAIMKSGSASHPPRPGARLTSGAESRNNPASVSQSAYDTNNPNEGRLLAARAAMNWKAKNNLS